MMSNYDHFPQLAQICKQAGERSILLTTGKDGRVNPMTIGWCMSGVMWARPVILVAVRLSRYSHDLLDQNQDFTIFCPSEDMKQTLGVCGSKSGRDLDKMQACGLTSQPSQYVNAPAITAPGTVVHCHTLYELDMGRQHLDDGVYAQFYAQGAAKDDWHTFYFAQVEAITQNK